MNLSLGRGKKKSKKNERITNFTMNEIIKKSID